jgi:hypothetical protein
MTISIRSDNIQPKLVHRLKPLRPVRVSIPPQPVKVTPTLSLNATDASPIPVQVRRLS